MSKNKIDWYVCRTCQRFLLEVNKHGICSRCSNENKVPPPIMFVYYLNHIVPISSNGKIMISRKWKRVCKLVDDFYANVPFDQYVLWNIAVTERTTQTRASKTKEGYVYLIESENGYYKIGKSIDIERRLNQHEMDYPLKLRIIHSFESSNARRDEKKILDAFSQKNLRGEWFQLDECDIAWFKSIEDFSLPAAMLKFGQRKRLFPTQPTNPLRARIFSLRERLSNMAIPLQKIVAKRN